jgi:hypothetical protein
MNSHSAGVMLSPFPLSLWIRVMTVCMLSFLLKDRRELLAQPAHSDSAGAVASLELALSMKPVRWASLSEMDFADVALSQLDAQRARKLLMAAFGETLRAERAQEMKLQVLQHEGFKMPFYMKIFGKGAKEGRRLFISMHGGGGAPASVNNRQWDNQKTLYAPEEGIYVAPRAPTDTWNLWHQAHIDTLFKRLIQNMVHFHDVNPDRVYLMGYSAGGDGVYQLAPRIADYFAAASMMAGHPNESSPLGLRNLPFALFMGGKDAAYNRNQVAADWKQRLMALQTKDSEGYPHWVKVFPEHGHWMQHEDAVGIPWMSKYRRNKLPERIVWKQDDVLHERFYWLHMPASACKPRAEVIVSRKGQVFTIEKAEVKQLTIRLSDAMADLDQPIIVRLQQGDVLFQGRSVRRIKTLVRTLLERGDPSYLFESSISMQL